MPFLICEDCHHILGCAEDHGSYRTLRVCWDCRNNEGDCPKAEFGYIDKEELSKTLCSVCSKLPDKFDD
jgi:hypothetical protein